MVERKTRRSLAALVRFLCMYGLIPVQGFATKTKNIVLRSRRMGSSQLKAWQSHVSTHPEPMHALCKMLDDITGKESNPPHLGFLFVGPVHAFAFEGLVERVATSLPNTRWISVVSGGVIGDGVELDEPSTPSMSILVGHLPQGAELELFSFNELTNPPPDTDSPYWIKLRLNDKRSSFLLFADPWSPIEKILAGLSSNGGEAVIAGGISVPTSAKPSVALDGTPLPQGSAVGLCLRGSMGLQIVVAQGCRPVGPCFVITEHDSSCIIRLDGKPALQALETITRDASIEEKQQISSGLVCGIAAGEQDDYLIRQITRFIPATGGIVIGSSFEAGDRFRFFVRDKKAAEEDLQLMVKRANAERIFAERSGSLVAVLQISCVARGRGLFGLPNVDISNLQNLFSEKIPISGFYANGEIGPVGIAGFSTAASTAFLHSFTTIAALFCVFDCEDTGLPDTSEAASSSHDKQVDAWG